MFGPAYIKGLLLISTLAFANVLANPSGVSVESSSPNLIIELNQDTEERVIDAALPTARQPDNKDWSVSKVHREVQFDSSLHSESILPGDTTYWQRLVFQANYEDDTVDQYVLSLTNPIINHLEVYLLDAQGNLVIQKSLGLLDQDYDAKAAHGAQSLAFQIGQNETLTLYLKKQSRSPAILLMDLKKDSVYQRSELNRYLFWGGIIAFLIGMAIYNGAIYAMAKSRSYLWYLAFYAVTFFYFGSIHGYGILLWPEWLQVWLGTHIMTLNFLLLWLVIRFAISFLDVKINAPKHFSLLIWFESVLGLGFMASFWIAEHKMVPMFSVIHIVGLTYSIWMAVTAYRNGFYPARFFLLSWSFVIIGSTIGLATYTGNLPLNFYTMHAFFIGSVFELLLLSIALADRIRYSEAQTIAQAYTDPRTNQPNLSFFKSERFDLPKSKFEDSQQLAVLLIQIEGVKNLLGLLGPNQMEVAYRKHIKEFENFLKTKEWIISYRLSENQPRYMVTLPGNQILIIVKYEGKLDSIVNQLLSVSDKSIKINEIETKFNFRIGVSQLFAPKNGGSKISFFSVNESYRQAQLALIHCEREKLNWMSFSDDQDEAMRSQLSILTDLRKAIVNSEFTIFVQPQFSLSDDALMGGEILVRWIHPEKGMVPPNDFIPIAEQTDNIYPITKIVIELSLRWLSELFQQYPELRDNFRLSINLSAHDIYRDDLITFIQEKTISHRIQPQSLNFEMTESAAMRDHGEFMRVINQLHSLGFGIALDDFGTGYSSMSYIQKMRVDEIKIDRSFVADIHKSKINQKIVKAIIQIADSTNAITVAEGIETEEERTTITQLGANYMQGFLTGRPIAAKDFAAQYLSKVPTV